MKTFEITVPGSTANVGSGVDCFGIALPLRLHAVISASDTLEFIFGSGFDSDIELEKNLFLSAALRVCALTGHAFPPVRVVMTTEIPQSRGLASSASAIVAGALCANELLDSPLTRHELISVAADIEGHPDNVVPCCEGGFTVAAMIDGQTLYRKSELHSLRFALAVPQYELSTAKARAVLPKTVELSCAIGQLQRACLLVSALENDDRSLLCAASEDLIFTPARRALIPGFDEVCAAAKSAGAFCSMISGAGPAIIALCDESCAHEAAIAMGGAFQAIGIQSTTHALCADNNGARIEFYDTKE
ncbi:MAG: homoserine kinase [Oscillospiraceae bacterium]